MSHKILFKCWDRQDYAIYLAHRQVEYGAEIGVLNGEMSEMLCRYNPQLRHIYLVDPYLYWPETYHDLRNQGQPIHDARAALVQTMCSTGVIRGELLRMTSEQASRVLPPHSLDFVYIDANHEYEFIKQDLELWTPILKPGGLLTGHDYHGFTPGVQRAVLNWCTANDQDLLIFERDTIWLTTTPMETKHA